MISTYIFFSLLITTVAAVCALNDRDNKCIDQSGFEMCKRAEKKTNALIDYISTINPNITQSYIFLACETALVCDIRYNNLNRELSNTRSYWGYFCSSMDAYEKCMKAKTYYGEIYDSLKNEVKLPKYMNDTIPINCEDYNSNANFANDVYSLRVPLFLLLTVLYLSMF